MSTTSDQPPRLTVVDPGPLEGRTCTLRPGELLIGRADDADVVIASEWVSRRHAYVTWNGKEVWISDADSQNGTFINGRRIHGPSQLVDGDVVQLGQVRMRFEGSSLAGGRQTTPHVSGPGFTNEFQETFSGRLYQAGENIQVDEHYDVHAEEPNALLEIWEGRGVGRVLIAIGLLVALTGFAGWMYLIFKGGASSGSPESGFNPFEAHVLGLPAAMVAFAAFGLGGLIASIGYSMSKAAQARYRRRGQAAGRSMPPY